jgi:hypothetical protein
MRATALWEIAARHSVPVQYLEAGMGWPGRRFSESGRNPQGHLIQQGVDGWEWWE